jgi:hypothetical protein
MSPAERSANRWARRAALLVLVIGAVVVLGPVVTHLGSVWSNPFESPRAQTQVVETHPGGKRTVTVSTGEANRSFVERALATGGLILVRVGFVALAAFLAGAVVQRTLLADFAMRVGPVEVPRLVPRLKRAADASEKGFADVEAELGRQARATSEAMTVAADAAAGVAGLESKLLDMRESLTPLLNLAGAVGKEASRTTHQETPEVE